MKIAEIKKQYESNLAWAQETRNALRAEIIKIVGNREWHFTPRKYNNEEWSHGYIAGLRVVDGVLQYCEAGGGSYMVHREGGKEVARVRTWHWQRFAYKHISWWIILYDIVEAVKGTCAKCEPMSGDVCTTEYKAPFKGDEVSSI